MNLRGWIKRAKRSRDDLDDARSDVAVDIERETLSNRAVRYYPIDKAEADRFNRVRQQMWRCYDNHRNAGR
jgi:hypothetical protein